MKKKRYFQDDILYQFFCFFLLVSGIAFITFSIISTINSPSTKSRRNILCIFVGLVEIYSFFRYESFIITIDDEKVMMMGEPFFNYDRSQYKAVIRFTDIKNISIIETRKNSRGRKYQGSHGYRGATNNPSLKYYLVFTRKSGRKVRMNVTNYTREHLLEIISEIIIRINANGIIYEGNDPIWIINHVKSE